MEIFHNMRNLALLKKITLIKLVIKKKVFKSDIPTYKLVRKYLVVNVIFDSGILKSKSKYGE